MLRTLDRTELYAAVWATPLSRLAEGCGISDAALNFNAWVRWAREHAAHLDPFARGLPRQGPDMSAPGL